MIANSNKFQAHPPSALWPLAALVFFLASIAIAISNQIRKSGTTHSAFTWILSIFAVLFILIVIGYILDSLKSIKITDKTIVVRNFWRSRTIERDEVTQIFIYLKTSGQILIVPKENPVFEITVKFDLKNDDPYYLIIRNRARYGSMWIANMYPRYQSLWVFLGQLDSPLQMDTYEFLDK